MREGLELGRRRAGGRGRRSRSTTADTGCRCPEFLVLLVWGVRMRAKARQPVIVVRCQRIVSLSQKRYVRPHLRNSLWMSRLWPRHFIAR